MRQILVLGLIAFSMVAAEAAVPKKQVEAQTQKQESTKSKSKLSEETVATLSDSAIDFEEWEKDFNSSMKDAKKTQCKGQNCKFKEMQALDPSFEF